VENLRKLPFFAALVLILIAVLLEVGQLGLVQGKAHRPEDFQNTITSSQAYQDAIRDLDEGDRDDVEKKLSQAVTEQDRPRGLAISYMALIDVLLLFTTAMIALSLVVPEHLHAKLQGVVTLIFSFLLAIGALILTIIAFVLLIVMVTLFFAPPWGTLAYLGVWGFFNTSAATVVLGLLMFLKLGYSACMALAQQRFLQNRGLILLVLTSLVANLVIGFLHGLVPFVMVSITDALAAIVLGIVAIIWAIVFLIGAIIAIVQAILTR
jgi:hypothetical protein